MVWKTFGTLIPSLSLTLNVEPGTREPLPKHLVRFCKARMTDAGIMEIDSFL
jgi:hypothetical protein